MGSVLIPIPDRDFDPTEVAVSWSALPLLGAIPLVGLTLRANKAGRSAYRDLVSTNEFRHPLTWAQVTLDGVDGLLLPGGHRARGMRSYIDSDILHRLVVEAFARGLVVAAICHGVLLAARSIDPRSGRSVL